MANVVTNLAELESLFLAWMDREVHVGRTKIRTLQYYRTWIGRFVSAAGGDTAIADLVAFDLERCKTGWHSVQSVQRLFNWGMKAGLLDRNPFAGVERPQLGQRQLTLSLSEVARLLRACRPSLRMVLMAMRLTLARPQEIRELRWCDYREDMSCFVLTEFKCLRRRKDGLKQRILPVAPRLVRALERLRRRNPDNNDPIFKSTAGRPWTSNSLRLAVRRAAKKAGLDGDGREHVVAYTLRHTGATEAMAGGVPDRVLAELMGHTSTRTTARYQHPQAKHLHEAIRLATERRRRPA